MADTITRTCKICEEEFDSIYAFDEGICEECREKLKEDQYQDEDVGDLKRER